MTDDSEPQASGRWHLVEAVVWHLAAESDDHGHSIASCIVVAVVADDDAVVVAAADDVAPVVVVAEWVGSGADRPLVSVSAFVVSVRWGALVGSSSVVLAEPVIC